MIINIRLLPDIIISVYPYIIFSAVVCLVQRSSLTIWYSVVMSIMEDRCTALVAQYSSCIVIGYTYYVEELYDHYHLWHCQ